VRIAVYDAAGYLVKIIANRVYSAGEYRLATEAGDLSSGIYFVKIVAGERVATQKLLLMK